MACNVHKHIQTYKIYGSIIHCVSMMYELNQRMKKIATKKL